MPVPSSEGAAEAAAQEHQAAVASRDGRCAEVVQQRAQWLKHKAPRSEPARVEDLSALAPCSSDEDPVAHARNGRRGSTLPAHFLDADQDEAISDDLAEALAVQASSSLSVYSCSDLPTLAMKSLDMQRRCFLPGSRSWRSRAKGRAGRQAGSEGGTRRQATTMRGYVKQRAENSITEADDGDEESPAELLPALKGAQVKEDPTAAVATMGDLPEVWRGAFIRGAHTQFVSVPESDDESEEDQADSGSESGLRLFRPPPRVGAT